MTSGTKAKLIVFSFISALMSGCAQYPISNANMLKQTLPYNYQYVVDGKLSEAQVISSTRAALVRNKEIVDDLSAKKYNDKSKEFYDEAINSFNDKYRSFIKEKIISVFLSKSSYRSGTNHYPSFRHNTTSVLNDDGKGNFSLQFYDPRLYTTHSGSTQNHSCVLIVNVTGSSQISNGNLSGQINNISTNLNVETTVNRGKPSPAISLFTEVSYDSAFEKIKKSLLEFPPKKVSLEDYIYNEFQRLTQYRFKAGSPIQYTKIEKKFQIDFATAKSRIQRGLNQFKYNDQNSTFTFNETLSYRPTGQALVNTQKTIIISLFPDRDNTVITYSGSYSPITDSFGGDDIYGEAYFEKGIREIDQEMSKLLAI